MSKEAVNNPNHYSPNDHYNLSRFVDRSAKPGSEELPTLWELASHLSRTDEGGSKA